MCDWLKACSILLSARAFAILMEFWKKFVDDLVAIQATNGVMYFVKEHSYFFCLCIFKSRWATMSAVVRLVRIRFLLVTYVKDILSRSTKTNSNRVIEFVY